MLIASSYPTSSSEQLNWSRIVTGLVADTVLSTTVVALGALSLMHMGTPLINSISPNYAWLMITGGVVLTLVDMVVLISLMVKRISRLQEILAEGKLASEAATGNRAIAEELRAEIQTLERKKEELKNLINQERPVPCTELETSFQEMKRKLKEVDEQLKSKDREIGQKSEEFARVQEEIDQLQAKADEIKGFVEQEAKLRQKIEELQKDKQRILDETKQQLQAEQTKLLQEATTHLDSLESEKLTLEEWVRNLSKKKSDLEQKVYQLGIDFEKAQSDFEAMEAEKEACTREKKTLEEEKVKLGELKLEKLFVKEQQETAERDLKHLTTQIAEKKRELEELERAIVATQGSSEGVLGNHAVMPMNQSVAIEVPAVTTTTTSSTSSNSHSNEQEEWVVMEQVAKPQEQPTRTPIKMRKKEIMTSQQRNLLSQLVTNKTARSNLHRAINGFLDYLCDKQMAATKDPWMLSKSQDLTATLILNLTKLDELNIDNKVLFETNQKFQANGDESFYAYVDDCHPILEQIFLKCYSYIKSGAESEKEARILYCMCLIHDQIKSIVTAEVEKAREALAQNQADLRSKDGEIYVAEVEKKSATIEKLLKELTHFDVQGTMDLTKVSLGSLSSIQKLQLPTLLNPKNIKQERIEELRRAIEQAKTGILGLPLDKKEEAIRTQLQPSCDELKKIIGILEMGKIPINSLFNAN